MRYNTLLLSLILVIYLNINIQAQDTDEYWEVAALTEDSSFADPREMLVRGDTIICYNAWRDLHFTSDMGKTWIDRTDSVGYPSEFVKSITWNKNGAIFITKGWSPDYPVYKTTDFGNSWEKSDNYVPPGAYLIRADTGNTLYLCSWYGKVYLSIDQGETYRSATVPHGMGLLRSTFYFDINDSGKLLLIWLDYFQTENQTFYVLSNDKGETWKYFASFPGGGLRNICLGNSGSVYLVNAAWNLYVSHDDTESYDSLGNFPGYTGLLEDPDNNLFVFTETNIFYKKHNSNEWITIGSDDMKAGSYTLNENGEVYIVANSKIYKFKKEVVSVKDDYIITEDFSLSQNYPNPFNPSTNINFSIKEAGTYKLSVYNMLGEEVKILVNKQLPAGEYTEKFDAAGLTSGVYIYRLSGKNINLTNKMILMK